MDPDLKTIEFAAKVQMDVEVLRAALISAVRAQLGGLDGEVFVWVEAFTTAPENTVVVGSNDRGETMLHRFDYSIRNVTGDRPRIDIKEDSGVEVFRDFTPVSKLSKASEEGLLAVPLKGVKLDRSTRTIEGYASVFGITDRDGDVMQKGAFTKGLDEFMAHPVMLWNHGRDPDVKFWPVGSWDQVGEDAKGLFVRGTVAKDDPIADRIWNLIEQGHANALSVGGRFQREGKSLIRWDLVEISIASVPSNPFANFDVAKGIGFLPASTWDAEHLLEQLGEVAAKSAPSPGDPLDQAMHQIRSVLDNAITAAGQGVMVGEDYVKQIEPAMELGVKALEGSTVMDQATKDAIAEAVAAGIAGVTASIPEAIAESMKGVGGGIATAIAETNAKIVEDAAAQKIIDDEAAAEREKLDSDIAAKAIEDYRAELRKSGFTPVSLESLPTGTKTDENDMLSPSRLIQAHKYNALSAEDLAYWHMSEKVLVPFLYNEPFVPREGVLRAMALKAQALYAADKLPSDLIGPVVSKSWRDLGDAGGEWTGGKVIAPWAMKADELMESDLAGFGLEWVPTLWTAQMWDRIRLENEVVSFLQGGGNVFDMPSDPYTIPLESADPAIKKAPQATAEVDFTFAGPAGISRVGTANNTLTTSKMMAVVPFTRELDEDSIIPVVPQLRRQTERAMADALESIIINGDTTVAASSNINDIAGTPAATDVFLVADGLRHLGLITTVSDSLDLGVVTLGKIRRLRALMGLNGKMGIRASDLMLVCDPTTYYQLIDIDEVVTVDKFGPSATVRTGGLDGVDGVRIHPSEEMVLANTAGKIDLDTPTLNTRGNLVIWNRRQFRLGFRRRMNMEVERVPFADGGYLVASMRVAFQARDTEGVAVGFNIDVS